MFTSYTERFPHCVGQTALKSLCVCMYGGGGWQRGRQLWRLTAEVWRPRTGLQGSASTTECVFLVLFWPWSAHRKKRKKIETSCRSLEGSSGTGESVWESASIVVFRGWISYLPLPVAEVERREIMGRVTKVSLEKHCLLIASVYRTFREDRAF